MQISLVMALLASLAIAEAGPSKPLTQAGYRLLAALLLMAMVPLFALVISRTTLRKLNRNVSDQRAVLKRYERWRTAHRGLWLAVVVGIAAGLAWGRLVRFNGGLGNLVLIDDLLILLPALLPLFLSWAAFYDVDRAVRVVVARAAGVEAQTQSRLGYLGFQLRHNVGVLLAPLIVLLTVDDLLRRFAPGLAESPRAWLGMALPGGVLLFLFPFLLCRLWDAAPLEGPLGDRLRETCQRIGVRVRRIMIWRTGRMIANAAVVGLVPWHRHVLISDGLLATLNDDEIVAVLGHEAGHVAHHHTALRMLAVAAPGMIAAGLLAAFPGFQADMLQAGAPLGENIGGYGAILTLLLIGLQMLIVFAYYSRRMELQADLFACRVQTPIEPRSRLPHAGVVTFTSALEKLAALHGVSRDTSGWQHFSIARRVEFLQQMFLDPAAELRFHRRLRLLAIIVLLATLLGAFANLNRGQRSEVRGQRSGVSDQRRSNL